MASNAVTPLEVKSWICFTFGVGMVCVRGYTISLSPRGARVTWDLIFIMTAAVFAIAAQPFIVLAARHGIDGAPSTTLTDLAPAFKWQWIYLPFAVMATTSVKLSNIALLMRLQRKTNSRQRNMLFAAGFISVLMAALFIITEWTQCIPKADAWTTEPTGNPSCTGANRWLATGVAQGSLSALVDFFLASYPIVRFWDLQVPTPQKIKIFLLFGGGYLAGLGAVLRTIHVLSLNHPSNRSQAAASVLLWSQVEQHLAISVTILPRLRTLLKQLRALITSRIRPSIRGLAREELDLDLDGRPARTPVVIELLPRQAARIDRRHAANEQMFRIGAGVSSASIWSPAAQRQVAGNFVDPESQRETRSPKARDGEYVWRRYDRLVSLAKEIQSRQETAQAERHQTDKPDMVVTPYGLKKREEERPITAAGDGDSVLSEVRAEEWSR